MAEVLRTNIAIIGAGALGLEAATQFSAAGHDVALLDAQPTLAKGPTTRNGKFLHKGSYYLAAIRDGDKAERVSAGIGRGYDRILSLAPHAVERGTQTFALVHEGEDVGHVRDRWGRGGIQYDEVTPDEFRAANPKVAAGDIIFAARVPDKSIDTATYLATLRDTARQNGTKIFTEATVVAGKEHDTQSTVRIGGQDVTLVADHYLVTAGYGAPEIYKTVTDGERLDLELWKHHLLALPRTTDHNVMALYPGRPYVTTNGVSLVGINKSEIPVATADFDVVDEKADEIRDQARAFLPDADHRSGLVHACVTLHVPGVEYYGADGRRIQRGRWTFAWPGKMTSAPDVAADLVRDIGRELPSPRGIEVFSSIPYGLPVPQIEPYPYSELFAVAR